MEDVRKSQLRKNLGEDYPFEDECESEEEYKLKYRKYELKRTYNPIFKNAINELQSNKIRIVRTLFHQLMDFVRLLSTDPHLSLYLRGKKPSKLGEKLISAFKRRNMINSTYTIELMPKITDSLKNRNFKLVIQYSHQKYSALNDGEEAVYLEWCHPLKHECLSHLENIVNDKSIETDIDHLAFLNDYNSFLLDAITELMLNPDSISDYKLQIYESRNNSNLFDE